MFARSSHDGRTTGTSVQDDGNHAAHAARADDDNPTYLFLCDEDGSNPAVQRVDLSKPANASATTIVTGLSSCGPVRRTPWGSIIVAEEAGSTGGLYEILDPVNINAPIAVTNRATSAREERRS